jgi:hypothetical protein
MVSFRIRPRDLAPSPEKHQLLLDGFVRSAWRWVAGITAVLILGALAELVG